MTGQQYYMDAHVAYRRACLNAIEYLKKFGFTGEQAYLLSLVAPVEGTIVRASWIFPMLVHYCGTDRNF